MVLSLATWATAKAVTERFADLLVQSERRKEAAETVSSWSASRPRALEAVEGIQEKVKQLKGRGGADQMSAEVLEAAVMRIMSIRDGVHSIPGSKRSLKRDRDERMENQSYMGLRDSGAVRSFIAANSQADLCRFIAVGHGGRLESEFRKFLARSADKLPETVPERFMPTARERIEALQMRLRRSPRMAPEKQRDVIMEIMACRRAVGAVRGGGKQLDQPMNGALLADCRAGVERALGETVDELMRRGMDLAALAREGHGGKMEVKVQEIRDDPNKLPVPAAPRPDRTARAAVKGG